MTSGNIQKTPQVNFSESDWTYLKSRTAFLPREAILEMAVRLSFKIPGNIVEFGVAEGHSTRVIRLQEGLEMGGLNLPRFDADKLLNAFPYDLWNRQN